jgi:small subunit ribosomal protein S29
MYDITGIRDDEPEPCPRVWDETRKCWTDSWKEFLFEHEITYYQQQYDAMNFRLSDKLTDPKKLIDIAKAGAEDKVLATNAFAELLNQCYTTDKFQTLMCVDGVNTFLQPSAYPSFRYANHRNLKMHIPPHDLALVRLIMKFDG